jgi:hypothetical protein
MLIVKARFSIDPNVQMRTIDHNGMNNHIDDVTDRKRLSYERVSTKASTHGLLLPNRSEGTLPLV